MLGRQWRYCMYAAVAVIVFASAVPQSFAHPVYVDSEPGAFDSVPSAPEEVNVFFSEPIELSYSSIRVLGPDGNRVDMNEPHNVEGDTASIGVALQPGLPEGEYTVTTKVLSAVDGHIVEATFLFGVGVSTVSDGTTSTPLLAPGYSLSRFPGMVGQVMVVGAAFATLWLWKPLARVPWLSSAIARQRVSIDRNMMHLIIIGTGIVLASGVAMIVVQAVSIEAGIADAIATNFGNVWVTRMLQSSILMGIAFAVYRRTVKNNSSPGRAEMYAILILGLAVLVTSSLITHAAATEQVGPIMLDFFHNAAASIWIGGLILLGFVAVPKLLAIGDERTRAAAISILIPRFSTVVVTLLGIAVITGPVLLFTLESDLALTVASVYGQILAIKLGLAGTMVAMGAYSQFVVEKRAVAVMVGGAGVKSASLKNYSRTLKAEAGLGIALLLAVSFMANGALPSGQFPAYVREADDQAAFAQEIRTDLVRTLYTGEGTIELSIAPFAIGQNAFRASFFNQDGSNATGIESATIKLTQLEQGIGPIDVELTRQSGNVFSANAAFSLPGTWRIAVEGVNTQGSNMLSAIDLNVKPQVSNLEFEITEYKIPAGGSLPLYPIFDAERQSIWVGDSLPGSGRIWQLDIATGNYTVHRVNATLITQSALAPNGSLWYIDPIGVGDSGVIGWYNPANNSTKRFVIPEEGVPSGLAMDNNGSLWIPVQQANKVVKFDPTNENFTSYDIPTRNASPYGISADRSGNIWFAEAIGKIAKIDPESGNITEYAPGGQLRTLEEPTAVFPDPESFDIYIAEHSGHTVTVFNSLLGTFSEYPSVNEGGLPFGMAMDRYGNLWFAQHEIDRVGVIDPRTGAGAEAKIPISGSAIQWITADDNGKIWFAAQRGGSLGSITITAGPSTAPPPDEGGQNGSTGGIPQLPFSFADAAGPVIAIGIVASALAYSKSAIDLRRNVRAALRSDRH